MSQFTKHQLMERYQLPEEKITVIYCGVPEEILRLANSVNGSFLQQWPLEGKKVLLYIGSLTERKNLFFLIDVFEEVKKCNPDVLLILCGDRPHPRDRHDVKLRERVVERGLQRDILFVGKRVGYEKWALLQRADIFVFPSLLEGFGFAVSEAMAVGKPIVCSNRASLPELIEDEVTGLLSEAEDLPSFAGRVNRLLEDEALCRRLGEQARIVAKERFTWKRSSVEYRELFKHLISQKDLS